MDHPTSPNHLRTSRRTAEAIALTRWSHDGGGAATSQDPSSCQRGTLLAYSGGVGAPEGGVPRGGVGAPDGGVMRGGNRFMVINSS
jgi:hypothetical protein